ncbi:MAG: hypothetical protein ACM3JJ_12840 [Hyphomicrobiales bacterium]
MPHDERFDEARNPRGLTRVLRPDLILFPTLVAAATLLLLAALPPPSAHADDGTNMRVYGKAGQRPRYEIGFAALSPHSSRRRASRPHAFR